MPDRQSHLAHARGLIILGLPIIGSHVAHMLLNVTDTVMLGWYGVEELAALVLATSYFFFLYILGSGFGIGLMGLLPAALATGDEAQARRSARMALWLSAIYGVAMLPLLFWSGPVLRTLGQTPELSGITQTYLRIVGFGMLPGLLMMVLRSWFAALEKAGVLLWVNLGGVALNAVLNWALIFGNWGMPELGVRGAAIATLATQVLQLAALAACAVWLPRSRPFRLFVRIWRPDWPAFGRVFRLGLPAGLTLLAESGLFSAASMMMGWVGTRELAAHGIALQMASLAFMMYLGLSNAATIKVGRAHGAGDPEGMRAVALAAVGLTVAICAVVVGLFLAFPEAIIGTFLDDSGKRPEDVAAILAIGAGLLALAAVFQLFDAMQVMALGFLRGVQDARVPMWLAAVSYWLIGIPVSYLLAFPGGWGATGIWVGLILGLAAASGLLMWRFWRGAWIARPVGDVGEARA